MELFFGSTRIQDCWLSLHCFSTNLSRNRLQAWCLGSIPTAVIASLSVPGIFPPVEDSRGELHVDGGILDNLPIAAARGLSDGRVIAVSLDVDPDSADEDSPDRKRRRSSLARTIISAMMCASHSQSRAQENLADLVLKPEIGAYPFLDWKSYREIFLAGQSHARSRLGDGTRFRRPPAPRS
jgi:predicted acylesterase/phospholipase RssA